MKTNRLTLLLIAALTTAFAQTAFAQTKTVQAPPPSSVEKEKFVFLNNGATVGMIIKSVLKADTQRMKLTAEQVPKAKTVITNAVVAYNEGVKTLKKSKSGMNQKALRTLAIGVETDKVKNYKPILTPDQYKMLVAQHMKMYPESKL